MKGKDRNEASFVPFADMLNHEKPEKVNVHWKWDSAEQAFTIIATKNIARGEEVYDTYGSKSNSLMLLNYGFTQEDNAENTHLIL